MDILKEITVTVTLRIKGKRREEKTVATPFFFADFCIYLTPYTNRPTELIQEQHDILREIEDVALANDGVVDNGHFFEFENEDSSGHIRKPFAKKYEELRKMLRALSVDAKSTAEASRIMEEMTRLESEEVTALQQAARIRYDVLIIFGKNIDQTGQSRLQDLIKKLEEVCEKMQQENILYPYQTRKQEEWEKREKCTSYLLSDTYTLLKRVKNKIEAEFYLTEE